VLALARAKLDQLTQDDQRAIEALHGERALIELNGALGQAGSPSDARAAFELVVRRFRTI
jgi:hypothetical protein